MPRLAIAVLFPAAFALAQAPAPVVVPPTGGVISTTMQGGGGQGGRRTGGGQQARKEYTPEELCTVEGTVRNGVSGEGLSKATVTLYSSNRGGGGMPMGMQNHAATTDASGKFTVRGVEPGQYRISVRRNGYVSSEQSGRRAVSPSGMLTLATSQAIKNVEVKLIPHGVVTGRVTDSDGEPIAYANVQMMLYRYTPQGQRELMPLNNSTTNDLGEFRLFGVPPGKYYVSVTVQNRFGGFQEAVEESHEGPVPTYYPGATEVAQATPVDVQMGGTVQGIDIRVLKARTYRVSGVIVNVPQGRRNGMVMLEPKNQPYAFMGRGPSMRAIFL